MSTKVQAAFDALRPDYRKDFTVLSVRRQCFKGIRAASKSGCFRAKRQSVRVRSNPLAAA